MNFEELKKEYNNLNRGLGDPLTISNRKEYGKLSKRFSFLEKIIEKINKKEKLEKNIKENEEILKTEKNEEFRSLIKEETQNLENDKKKIEEEIKKMMAKGDDSEENSILIEIRAGTGGEEAALFSKTLFEMYKKFSQKMNWELNIMDSSPTDLDGLREISFEVKGEEVKDWFLYEGGVHRVQRIPATEKKGRIHTSTVSVAVLEKPREKDIKINPQDLKIETYRASGPGGQYVNRRESAIRITHLPTGVVAASQSARTQIQNRENAFSLLRTKIFEKKKEEEEEKLGAARKSQIGKAKRSEKIRTYNFPQDRITDHRIKKSWGHIEEILQGNLDKMVEDLKNQEAKQD